MALTKVTEAVVQGGVEYHAADIKKLLFDESGACTGAESVDGRTWTADHVILCTGAATARLIADSAPWRKDIQVGDRMVAAAVVTGLAKLSQSLLMNIKMDQFLYTVELRYSIRLSLNGWTNHVNLLQARLGP